MALVGCAHADPAPAEPPAEEALVGNVASFQNRPCAASADGNEIFWLECDAGGSVRRRGASSFSTTLAREASATPAAIAIDATDVYWVTLEGNVRAVPRAGGAARDVGTVPASSRGYSMVVDDTDVTIGGVGGITRIPKGGGASVAVVTLARGQFFYPAAAWLSADATTLYFLREDGDVSNPPDLVALPKTGSYPANARVLAQGVHATALALDSANVTLAIDTSGLDRSDLVVVPKSGGAPTTIGTLPLRALSLASDGAHVCAGGLDAIRCTTGSASRLIGAGNVRGVLIVGGDVVWTNLGQTTRDYNPWDMMPSDLPNTGSVHRARL